MQCYLYDLGYLTAEEEEEEEGEKSRAFAYKVFCGSGLIAGLHRRRYDTRIKFLR